MILHADWVKAVNNTILVICLKAIKTEQTQHVVTVTNTTYCHSNKHNILSQGQTQHVVTVTNTTCYHSDKHNMLSQ